MSYDHKINGMVGQHLAEWQVEVTLANGLRKQVPQTKLPFGYANGIYHPFRGNLVPRNPGFVSHLGGTLSNGVPKVLGLDFRDQYPLGAYNPH